MATDERVTRTELLDRARAAADRKAWATMLSNLQAADAEAPLDLDGLERLAFSAQLVGRDDLATGTGMRAFAVAAQSGEVERAARAGFWTGMAFARRGEFAQAGAWFGRARELVETAGRDSVEAGYVLIPDALRILDAGDGTAAYPIFERIAAIAERFGDPDLTTLSRLGRGQALIAVGDRDRGMSFLDQAMAAVTAGETSPSVAGIVYCATVAACHEVLDIRRAREWTEALTEWCASQPDLVPFRGQCLVNRAVLKRFHGEWSAAADEVDRARTMLLGPPVDPAVGEAHYEEAELHRLAGRYDEAERSYTEASRFGRRPEPGLALLRLAQDRPGPAWAMLSRALEESPNDLRLLEAAITVGLARGDVAEARGHMERLRAATTAEAPALLRAVATRSEGEVLLAEGDPRGALQALRSSFAAWQQIDAPYEAARVRVSIAAACRALGDDETAELEATAARQVFEDLGAEPALAALDRALEASTGPPLGLSPRELEVLGHLARGRTNREISDELGISERTVDRHVSNLYTKLDVSSRAAATAWAYEHDLA